MGSGYANAIAGVAFIAAGGIGLLNGESDIGAVFIAVFALIPSGSKSGSPPRDE